MDGIVAQKTKGRHFCQANPLSGLGTNKWLCFIHNLKSQYVNYTS